MLIGVDHGNKQIKTVHCNPFVSGLKQSVTRPFGQNVLRYQNTYYTLSTERIPYRKDKTEDDRFFILTLFALAGEIEARGAYSSEVQRIQLAVGLPPAHFGAQVERFTQYFGQRGMVEFEVQGKLGISSPERAALQNCRAFFGVHCFSTQLPHCLDGQKDRLTACVCCHQEPLTGCLPDHWTK